MWLHLAPYETADISLFLRPAPLSFSPAQDLLHLHSHHPPTILVPGVQHLMYTQLCHSSHPRNPDSTMLSVSERGWEKLSDLQAPKYNSLCLMSQLKALEMDFQW